MKIIRKIGPLLLLPLIVLSSIGFTFDVHFCKNSIKDISFFEADGCEMNLSSNKEVDASSCHKKCKKTMSSENKDQDSVCKKKCCHNQRFNYDVPGDIAETDSPINIETVNAVFLYVLCDYFSAETGDAEPGYRIYQPPLSRENLSVLYQVFRI